MLIQQQNFRTIWPNEATPLHARTVAIIDQTKLPHAFEIVQISSVQQMVQAIVTMQVRGAPLIGAAAAYGMALAVQENATDAHLQASAAQLLASRPTAVNLQWAVNRMLACLQPMPEYARLAAAWALAAQMADEDVVQNQAIGQHGLALIRALHTQHARQLNILTHCNAGWLATVDYGTALAPIYAAHDAGLAVHVWVGETRPRNQGASLSAWELAQHGVPHTVVADNAVGHLMQRGMVDMVIVGADRVTATGDVCNKIGTYLRALASQAHQVPFYAAVPTPTIDFAMQDGVREIPIETRSADEIKWMQGKLANGEITNVQVLPSDSAAFNPAFDVTPARLVTGIITEQGVFAPQHLTQLNKA